MRGASRTPQVPSNLNQSPPVKRVETPDAPKPAGHYSQGIAHAGLVFVAGQLPIDPHDPAPRTQTIEEQTERTLRNVEAVLLAAGSGLDLLLQVTVYITDVELWPRVNTVYARVLGDHKPARAVVPVKPLRHGADIEIQAIATIRDQR